MKGGILCQTPIQAKRLRIRSDVFLEARFQAVAEAEQPAKILDKDYFNIQKYKDSTDCSC